MQNYKLDFPGHRMQMVYALRSYILEKLARKNRNSWTYDEQELVAWVERQIKNIRSGYATRLQTSWKNFQAQRYTLGDALDFNYIYGVNIPDYQSFVDPQYFIPTVQQSQSLVEYQTVNEAFNYKNPDGLANLELKYLTIPAGI